MHLRTVFKYPLLLLVLVVAGCTTTTRSVNESPQDPQVQRQPQQQAPTTTPTRQASRRTSTQTLSAAQMDRLVQADVDQLLQRGVTSSQQVIQVFGRPHSMTRSGEELYWNYTHQFRDERRNVGGLKSLTILFDQAGRVQDYDFQDNTFNLN
ncbi:MAG: outer membrane protein assembly factor BamE [Idiomarina sp.]|nr:outer membrane protein assembly factor BamE [Idiomarina sp.]